MNGLELNQYMGTGMSPNHKCNISTIDFYYIEVFRTGISIQALN